METKCMTRVLKSSWFWKENIRKGNCGALMEDNSSMVLKRTSTTVAVCNFLLKTWSLTIQGIWDLWIKGSSSSLWCFELHRVLAWGGTCWLCKGQSTEISGNALLYPRAIFSAPNFWSRFQAFKTLPSIHVLKLECGIKNILAILLQWFHS